MCSHPAVPVTIYPSRDPEDALSTGETAFPQYFPPWTSWRVSVSVIKAAAKVGVRAFFQQ